MVFALSWLLLASESVASGSPYEARQWASLDLHQIARQLPSIRAGMDAPLGPGARAGYHRAWLGTGRLSGGTFADLGVGRFDQLFWELSADGGAEVAWRGRGGLFASLRIGLGYARIFTGDNSFALEDGVYRQRSDPGRGFLRITPVDLSLGFAPEALRRVGLVPALTYAWSLDAPLYDNEDGTVWSYTRFGLSLSWMWGG
jgi:hypothetical protein